MESVLGQGQISHRTPSEALGDVWTHLSNQRPVRLRFVLLPCRRSTKALCPVLQATLTSPDGGVAHTVTRILDPEHRQPYVSLGALLLASGRSVVSGLLEMGLRRERGDYELHLAGVEPFDELWAPLPRAAAVARALGLQHRLATLLDRRNGLAWSLDEGEAGVVHNWRAPPADVDPAVYSTDALLAARIGHVHLLPNGEAVRTLLSEAQRTAILRAGGIGGEEGVVGPARQRQQERMVRWSTACYEVYLEVQEARRLLDQADEADIEEEAQMLARQAALLVADVELATLAPTQQHVSDWLAGHCAAKLWPASSPNTNEAVPQPPSLPLDRPIPRSQQKDAAPHDAEPLAKAAEERGAESLLERVERLHGGVHEKLKMLHHMQLLEVGSTLVPTQQPNGNDPRISLPLQVDGAATGASRRKNPLESVETLLLEVQRTVEGSVAKALAERSEQAATAADVRRDLQEVRDEIKVQVKAVLEACNANRPPVATSIGTTGRYGEEKGKRHDAVVFGLTVLLIVLPCLVAAYFRM
ncbi:hypothetical protein ACQY0O_000357 [Thecaphora frezii]